MKKIRTGNDIHLTWTITKNDKTMQGEELDLQGAEVLLIDAFNHPQIFYYEINTLTSAQTQVVGTFYGKDQKTHGKYRLLLVKNRGQENMITLDYADAFILTCVSKFGVIGGEEESTVTVATVDLESDFNVYNGSPDMQQYYTKEEINELLTQKQNLLQYYKENQPSSIIPIISLKGAIEDTQDKLINGVFESDGLKVAGGSYVDLLNGKLAVNGVQKENGNLTAAMVLQDGNINCGVNVSTRGVDVRTIGTNAKFNYNGNEVATKADLETKQNILDYYSEEDNEAKIDVDNASLDVNALDGGTIIGNATHIQLDSVNGESIVIGDTGYDAGISVTTPTNKRFVYNGNEVATKADLNGVVHTTGDEVIRGEKDFMNYASFYGGVSSNEDFAIDNNSILWGNTEGFGWLQDVDGVSVQDLLDDKQDVLTFDSTPTSGSSNPVTSNGIYEALQNVGTPLNLENGEGVNSIMSKAAIGSATSINEVQGESNVGLGWGIYLGSQKGNSAIGGSVENRLKLNGSGGTYTATISGTTTANNSQYGGWARAMVGNMVGYPLYDANGTFYGKITSATLDNNDLNLIHITTDEDLGTLTDALFENYGVVGGSASKGNVLLGSNNIEGSNAGRNAMIGAYNYTWGSGGYNVIGGAINANNGHQSVVMGTANALIGLDNQKNLYNTVIGGSNFAGYSKESSNGNKIVCYNNLIGYGNTLLTNNANATQYAAYTTLVGESNTHNHRGNRQNVEVFGSNNVTGHFRGTVVGQSNYTTGTEIYFMFGRALQGNPSDTQGMVGDNVVTMIGAENEPYSNNTKFILATGDRLTNDDVTQHNSIVIEAEGTSPRQPSAWTMTINDAVKYKDLTEVEGATVTVMNENQHYTTDSTVIDGVTYYYDPTVVITKGQIVKASASNSGSFVALATISNGNLTLINETLGEKLKLYYKATENTTVVVYGDLDNYPYVGIGQYKTIESISNTIGNINNILTQINGSN